MDRISSGIGPREHEHVVDQSTESTRLVAGDGQRFAIVFFVPRFAAERDFRRRTDDRDRRSRLVRSVGHELALRLQRRSQARDEAVDAPVNWPSSSRRVGSPKSPIRSAEGGRLLRPSS